MALIQNLLAILFVFIPVLLWGYIFSYYDGAEFKIRRFLIGIIAGALSVLPIVYSAEIFSYLGIEPIFEVLSGWFGITEFLIRYLGNFYIPVVVFFVSLLLYATPVLWKWKNYLVRFFALALVFTAIVSGLLSLLPQFGSGELTLQGFELRSFTAIMLAYIYIASLEEFMKHMGGYAVLERNGITQKQAILVAVYSALGFVFLENVFYLTNLVREQSIWSSSFFGTLFSRSVISLLLHIFATLILTLGFIKFIQSPGTRTGVSFLIAFLLSTFVHALFNISLTYGKMGIIGLYVFVGYFFFTKVFFDERKSLN